MNVAIIPARGGSKRIPRKNIKNFCGRPMIVWSIEAALESNAIDRVIVSTDDKEIASVANSYGADVPFIRPPELSDDFVGTVPVIKHAIEWLSQHKEAPSNVCCIYATAPFVCAEDLDKGFELLIGGNINYAFGVTSYDFPIQRAIKINRDMRVEMFQPENFNKRSQDLEEAWHDAGQFYWGTSEAWNTEQVIFSVQSVSIKIPRYRVQDIDTPEDWERAEWLFKAIRK